MDKFLVKNVKKKKNKKNIQDVNLQILPYSMSILDMKGSCKSIKITNW